VNSDATVKWGAMILVSILSSAVAEKLVVTYQTRRKVSNEAQVFTSYICSPVLSFTCPVVLHSLSLVRRFVDDLFVPDFPDFENFMYLNQDSFGGGIYPKTYLINKFT
jgi:hypothetical protein